MVFRGSPCPFRFYQRVGYTEAKAAMISILAQEGLLGAALGTVFAGVVIFYQRKDIYKTIAQYQPKSEMCIYCVDEVYEDEPNYGKKSLFKFAHYWNKAVDQSFGPAIPALSSRR